MYLGALMVFDQGGNPDRLALAAHSFRELMEKLPRYIDVPAESSPSSAKLEGLRECFSSRQSCGSAL